MTRHHRPRRLHPMHVVLFLSFIVVTLSSDVNEDDAPSLPSNTSDKVISIVDSISNSQNIFKDDRSDAMKTYWKSTFEEIKNLQVYFPETSSPLLNQWKAYLDNNAETNASTINSTQAVEQVALLPTTMTTNPLLRRPRPRRFDGFRNWERLLQEWTEDVAEYVERNTMESGNYPLSTFGVPNDEVTDQKEDVQDSMEEENEKEEADIIALSTPSSSAKSHAKSVKTVSKPANVPFLTVSTKNDLPPPSPRTVQPGEAVMEHTDIANKSKAIWIVTTASLPWMTGTAVNPLLRAAYLSRGRSENGGKVTLMLPWLEIAADQERIYNRIFESQQHQEDYVRTWLRETASMPQESQELNISWYPARQERAENSIYSMGDITALIPQEEVDICILEEPEHLNWYRAPGEHWTTKFKHVVGIIHTNYFVYAQEQPAAFIRAPAMRLLCSWMCRAHCHRVIKLSGTLGKFCPEKELVENVHGVRGTFLDIGEEVRKTLVAQEVTNHPVFAPDAPPTVYFIGKMLWSKGLGSLMELLKYAEESADLKLHVDMYGGGPDKDAADQKSKKLKLDMEYHGPVDHSKLAFSHKVFVNPSTSEVLCTTVSEALAMGKFVVLPSHPSNDFFAQFPNCLPYTNKEEFVGNLYYALTHSPAPLTAEYAHALSWEAATDRLAAAGSISVEEANIMEEYLESQDTGVEIELPPLIESDERRRKIVSTIRLSRARYRQFRSRLSEEIKQSKVLPKEVRRRMSMELDKRLDLDIDTVLESPKLRIQLSPAELDKRLLEFYTDVTKGARGDILRLIGGGNDVGLQNLYMRRQALKQGRRKRGGITLSPAFELPAFSDDAEETKEEERTPTEWVTLALRRNLPPKHGSSNSANISKDKSAKKTVPQNKATTKMSLTAPTPIVKLPTRTWVGSPLI